MGKRTTQTGLSNWEDTSDLEHVVKDKRAEWRGTPAKGRRRNRRYENRILRSQSLEDELAEDELTGDDLQEDSELDAAIEEESMNITEEADV